MKGWFTKTGVLTSLRRLFAKITVNECNRDLTTIITTAGFLGGL
jgi:hypothetical protein